ncbi:DegV family protein [Anaerosphaera multitolerans]|uniref:DegV family protein n=1 Tax=Anaerosphaera multitolerans TaxID=2487351 RepID=A0A437S5H5_9FIRM|nr:DegV family protein [Anaerosphaera multitolerans]
MRIITDSASDITIDEAVKLNIDIVPLTISFGDEVCPQNTVEDFDCFFEKLKVSTSLPVTSQPSPQLYLNIYNEAKLKGDDVLVITLAGGLSGTVNSANLAKDMIDYDRIRVIDSEQAIITQRLLVEHAVKLRDEGKELENIAGAIENLKRHTVVCGALDTLKFLKMGGRIPASMAFIGELLNIKPTIILKNSVLEELGKARGSKASLNLLYKEFEATEVDESFPVYFGHTSSEERCIQFMNETIKKYNLKNTAMFPISGVIGTHVGPGCLAIAFVRK